MKRHPLMRLHAMLAALVLSGLACTADAATYRVDDSATLPGEAVTRMRWRTPGPSRQAGDIVDGAAVVALRLNTAPFVNRSGRIYMVLPAQPVGTITVDWTTLGRMLPGALVSGNRTLVYAGPIRGAMLEDTFTLFVHADGKRLVSAQRLQFHFEIDVE